MRAALILAFSVSACATHGRIATPGEVALLQQAGGLSASGRITLSGSQGRLSAGLVFGVARPDSLRIEIPAGSGLRFLLIAKAGRLRADLPQDDAMFEGPATSAVMSSLFGIDLDPQDLVAAILGAPPTSLKVGWRFERTRPSQITIHGSNGTRLTLNLSDSEIQAPLDEAFSFGPPRNQAWTLAEMSERLGLRH